ncbi:MAG: glycerol-3-phosphate dehydrogenase 1-like protein, isoform CRA_b [Olpidium bornovanus]|uniref:glycerol-3-phosphate dehydrogenase (NAD(+)) n=1 Tax=Olpidium bornovanus TaxID=278681 RepID=A0A8H8DLM7_9FUNG|nr:MAG: glycerol-3-phosphate dehydrogenase 1-like protein, isoform CRA_b [Olpidium bornovanus]
MWVFEETIDGRKLSDIINELHENVKYLPGIKIPDNVVAIPDLVEAARDATLLVFVIPHQVGGKEPARNAPADRGLWNRGGNISPDPARFLLQTYPQKTPLNSFTASQFVVRACQSLLGHITPDCRAVSLIKGVDVNSGGLALISNVISETLGIDCSVLMGANIAGEVARKCFAEATLGYHPGQLEAGRLFKKLFDTRYFRVNAVEDVAGVELCGALKNVVAIGAGLSDGLKYGDNTKAALMRIGLAEMRKFAKLFSAGVKDDTFFESCGVADLITTCNGGRNRRVAEARVITGKACFVSQAYDYDRRAGRLQNFPVRPSEGLCPDAF